MSARDVFVLALAAVMPACAPAEERGRNAQPAVVESSDASLSVRGGLTLWRGEPFSGVVEEHDVGERLLRRTRLHDGLRDGLEERFYADGSLQSARWYASGFKQGRHRGWWPEGGRRFDLQFEGGRYQGTQQRWHENGSLYQLNHYENGVEVGQQRSWTAEGRLFANYFAVEGRRFGLIGAKPCFTVQGEAS